MTKQTEHGNYGCGYDDVYRLTSADLASERFIGAEKGLRRILVEVKSFVGRSDVKDLQEAIGQTEFNIVTLIRFDKSRRSFAPSPARKNVAVVLFPVQSVNL